MRRSTLSDRSRSTPVRRRAGLAPLEMVLSLPILLFVMGLMILIGTAGGWKLRTQINSRQAAFRSLEPRTGSNDGNPRGLPSNASMRYTDPNKQFLTSDPFAEFQVMRGPTLSGSSSSGGSAGQPIPVNRPLFDMQLGYRWGHTNVERGFPMLAKMPPHEFRFTRETAILDGTLWQYHTQNIPSNTDRRILYLYDFQIQALVPQLVNRFQMIASQIVQNPDSEALTPLEGDDPEMMQLIPERSPDFARRYSINVNYRQTYDPSFYAAAITLPPARVVGGSVPEPRVARSGNLFDPEMVRQQRVEPYKRSITRTIPRAMSQYYIGRYRSVIAQLQAAMPPDQAQIDALQTKIDQLNRFVASLPP